MTLFGLELMLELMFELELELRLGLELRKEQLDQFSVIDWVTFWIDESSSICGSKSRKKIKIK